MDDLLGYLLHGADPVLIENARDKAVNRKVIDLFLTCKRDFPRVAKVYNACYEDFPKPPHQRRTPEKMIKDIFGECLSEHKLVLELACRSIKNINMYRKMFGLMWLIFNVWFGFSPVDLLETLFDHLPDDLRARDLLKSIINAHAYYKMWRERMAATMLEPLAEESKCAICLEDCPAGSTVRVLLRCRHSFHSECVETWLRKSETCPLCRQSVLQ